MSRRPHFLDPIRYTTEGATLGIADRDGVVATSLEAAFDSATRNRGLLGRDALADGTAIIIAPCSAVHTFGMRFTIDVIFAASDGRVVKLRPALVPSRMAGALGAFATIEMAAGSIARAGLKVGDVLVVQKSEAAETRE